MKEKKNLIIILILLIGVVGITLAYFSSTTSIDNLFSTKKYGSTITEEFISPDSWLPGDETTKSIVATNTGEVDQAVRISYTEKWLDSNNNELNGWIHEDGSKSSHETEEELNNDERVAIINFDNNDDWTYKDGYYYYNYKLSPNESTSSLIKSVTFNQKTKLDDTCTATISDGKKTITCNSSGSDYDNAKYTLTFKIETVQFNKYMNAWNTDVAILNEQALFCDAFEVGEVVTYNNQDYYVLKDSSTENDYVTLIKKDPLTVEEVNAYSTDYISQDGEYPYYESDTCNENTQTGCSTNYDTSDVKKIVDGWSSSFSDDLVEIDGYKVGLINENIFNDYYEYKIISPSQEGYRLKNDDEIINHIFLSEKTYWINFKTNDSNTNIYKLGKYEPITEKIYNKSYIRPVINLKKNVIENTCFNRRIEYLSCDFGAEVTYDNEKYYVIEDSDSNKKYVTLLKKDLLTAKEVNVYSNDYVSQDGEYPFYESETCNENNKSNCIKNYDMSNLKIIVDGWSSKYNNDLINIDGYKARIVNGNEFQRFNFGRTYNGLFYYYFVVSDTVEWSYFSDKNYWMIPSWFGIPNDVINNIGESTTDYNLYSKHYVRPVINLKKSAIESGCHVYTSYSLGETVNYNNTNYCVINNSSTSDDYVTLIKSDPLTYDELVIYNNGYEIGRDSVDNNIGTISYYKSDTCYYNNDNDKNTTGCNTQYNNSFIKNVINNWSNTFSNDLKKIHGYKARLITNDDLNNMGHQFIDKTAQTKVIKSEYECLYSDADYWTMSSSWDSYSYIDIVSKTDGSNGYQKISNKYAVRPVINLKKCAIDNTCE